MYKRYFRISYFIGVIFLTLSLFLAIPGPAMANTISDNYVPPDLGGLNPQIPGYDLPLELSEIANYNEVNNKIQISDGAKAVLKANGFVAGAWYQDEDIVEVYKDLKDRGIPIFVTSDTLLHLYHIQFDETLMRIEEDEFYNDILILSQGLFDHFLVMSNTYTGDLAKAAERNAAFFAVGISLLGSSVPAGLSAIMSQKVNQEIAFIDAHAGFENSPLFMYKEDYSQYIPRGHYTRSEILKKYFKAMMWYGRMAFLIKGDDNYCPLDFCPALIPPYEAKLQTLQAALTAVSLPQIVNSGKNLQDIWDRIYTVTAFYVGLADDLTPYEYLSALNELFQGGVIDMETLAQDEDLFFAFKAKLALQRPPAIFGGTGEAGIFIDPGENLDPNQLDEILEKTKGMRLMGQRFVPDSYIFGQLVAPNCDLLTGNPGFTSIYIDGYGWVRGFPRGLDIMDLLGSNRARAILEAQEDTAYINFDEQRQKMADFLGNLSPSEWQRNLYWGWLYSLKPLLKVYGEGYQGFMKTGPWQDKQLNAALASWTELRHDTILYAKQSYTPIMTTSIIIPPPPVVGYVEPVPEFYGRLLALTRMTREGLKALQALDPTAENRLLFLEVILDKLLQISIKELGNEQLTNIDYEFIEDFGKQLEAAVLGVADQGTSTVLVADVHTESNTQQVLEEGVGHSDLILVAYKVPDGRILLGAGPVFSYYEFKQPMDQRLTDEAWKEMLLGANKPNRLSWTYSYTLGDGLVDLRDHAPDIPEPNIQTQSPAPYKPITFWPFMPSNFLPNPFPIFPNTGAPLFPLYGLNSSPFSALTGQNALFQTSQIFDSNPFNLNPFSQPFVSFSPNSLYNTFYNTFSVGGLYRPDGGIFNQGISPAIFNPYQHLYRFNYNNYNNYNSPLFWLSNPGLEF